MKIKPNQNQNNINIPLCLQGLMPIVHKRNCTKSAHFLDTTIPVTSSLNHSTNTSVRVS